MGCTSHQRSSLAYSSNSTVLRQIDKLVIFNSSPKSLARQKPADAPLCKQIIAERQIFPSYFKRGQVDDSTDLDQKIETEDPMQVEAIIHGTRFDRKVIGIELTECQPVYLLREDKLSATDTTNTVYGILRLILHADQLKLVYGEDTAGRSGIEQNAVKFKSAVPMSHNHGHEWQTAINPNLHQRPRIPSQ